MCNVNDHIYGIWAFYKCRATTFWSICHSIEKGYKRKLKRAERTLLDSLRSIFETNWNLATAARGWKEILIGTARLQKYSVKCLGFFHRAYLLLRIEKSFVQNGSQQISSYFQTSPGTTRGWPAPSRGTTSALRRCPCRGQAEYLGPGTASRRPWTRTRSTTPALPSPRVSPFSPSLNISHPELPLS